MAESDFNAGNALTIRGRAVRFDDNGLACLNDIWKAAGFSKNQRPSQWARLPTTIRKMERVIALVGKSHMVSKETMHLVYRTKRGDDAGTYADVRLALDYAEYLNPTLAIEVKEVFLRYKAADATLADDVLQRASPEDNRWAGARALARSNRNSYTKTLKDHDVQGRGYMECTEAVYQSLMGGKSYQLRVKRGLPPKANLRDAMNVEELSYVMAAEALSAERIEYEDRRGNQPCVEASAIGATAIRNAIEADRLTRQRKLI
jgi:KilA-N domain